MGNNVNEATRLKREIGMFGSTVCHEITLTIRVNAHSQWTVNYCALARVRRVDRKNL